MAAARPIAKEELEAYAENDLKQKLGDFPLYAFFLYSDEDKDVAEFMNQKTPWLHSLSNDDCLIYVFENPSNWPNEWKHYWQEKHGLDFDKKYAEWQKLTPYSRTDMAYYLADRLSVEKNHIPCMVFIESLSSNKVLQIPFAVNKADYHRYFLDLFTCVHRAVAVPKGSRLEKLQSEYRIVWTKWILPDKVKNWAKAVQEWGSILKETKDTLVQIFNPIALLITPLLPGAR